MTAAAKLHSHRVLPEATEPSALAGILRAAWRQSAPRIEPDAWIREASVLNSCMSQALDMKTLGSFILTLACFAVSDFPPEVCLYNA